MSKLKPGAALIYEKSDGIVYARYKDPPHNTIPRWIVGGDPDKVAMARGEILSYHEWIKLHDTAKKYPELKKQMIKLVKLYYLYKEN